MALLSPILSPTSPTSDANGPRIEIITQFGSWHVSRKNFSTLSERFRALFEINPFPRLYLSDYYCRDSVSLIRSFTRHPNSSTFQNELTADNVIDFYVFCCIWQIRRPLVLAVKFIIENFSEKDIINILISLTSTKCCQDDEENNKNYNVSIDTYELEFAIANSIGKYLPFLNVLNFAKIEKLIVRIPNEMRVEVTDKVLNFIIHDFNGTEDEKAALLNHLDFKECASEKLRGIFTSGGFVKYTIENAIRNREEKISKRVELQKLKEELGLIKKDANNFLAGINDLMNNKHGLVEFNVLNALRSKRYEVTSVLNENQLLEIATREKVPEAIFETALTAEKDDEDKALNIYNELTGIYNDISDELVAKRIVELARHRNKKMLGPLLTSFVKTNRPIFLLTAYEVSNIDYKAIQQATAEKCLKKAVSLKFKDAETVQCNILVKNEPKKCYKFCQERAEEDKMYKFNLGVLNLFGIGCKASKSKALELFRACVDEVNVGNLVLAVISPSLVQRQNYYEEFLANDGGQIAPNTYFVNRAILELYDEIIERIEGTKEKLYEFVKNLVIEYCDADAAEFLFKRSPDLLFSLNKTTSKSINPKEMADLKEKLLYTFPVVGLNVTEIPERQFRLNQNLEYIKIPSTCNIVGERCFEKSQNLKAILFEEKKEPATLQELRKYSFTKCPNMRAVFFPQKSIITTQESVFRKNSNLIYIELPQSLETISDKTFFFCEKLPMINIPQSVKEIGISSFEGCKALEFISLGRNLTKISDTAFQFCESLKIVIIPKSIVDLNERVFRFCTQLRVALIEEGIETIKHECFHGCKSLGFVSLPRKSLKKIEANAFTACESLRRVTVPKECVIEEGAFDPGCEILFYDDDQKNDNDFEE